VGIVFVEAIDLLLVRYLLAVLKKTPRREQDKKSAGLTSRQFVVKQASVMKQTDPRVYSFLFAAIPSVLFS
jgi:hypothetical protein